MGFSVFMQCLAVLQDRPEAAKQLVSWAPSSNTWEQGNVLLWKFWVREQGENWHRTEAWAGTFQAKWRQVTKYQPWRNTPYFHRSRATCSKACLQRSWSSEWCAADAWRSRNRPAWLCCCPLGRCSASWGRDGWSFDRARAWWPDKSAWTRQGSALTKKFGRLFWLSECAGWGRHLPHSSWRCWDSRPCSGMTRGTWWWNRCQVLRVCVPLALIRRSQPQWVLWFRSVWARTARQSACWGPSSTCHRCLRLTLGFSGNYPATFKLLYSTARNGCGPFSLFNQNSINETYFDKNYWSDSKTIIFVFRWEKQGINQMVCLIKP